MSFTKRKGWGLILVWRMTFIDRTQRSNFAFTGIFRRREQFLHTFLVAINLKVYNSFVSVWFSTASPTSFSALSTPVKNTRYPRKRETHRQMIKTFWSLLIFLEEKRKITINMLRNQLRINISLYSSYFIIYQKYSQSDWSILHSSSHNLKH